MTIKPELFFLSLALITGALIPIQAATNAAFSRSIGNPIVTGLMVLAVGAVGAILFLLISGTALPSLQQISTAPLYSYLGGIIVAIYVIMITFLVPRVGVANSIAFIVTGQIICAVVIDHFGFFNVPIRTVDINRVSGMVLMIIGIYLVMKK